MRIPARFDVPHKIALVSASALVIASSGLGAIYAWTTGTQHGLALACLLVLMAVSLELAKPLAIRGAFIAFRQWRFVSGLALLAIGIVAVAYSLTSELSLMSTARGDLAAERTKATRAQQELDKIGITRPAAEINAELSAVLQEDKRLALNGCDGWLASVRLRTLCVERVAPLRAELAKAERREHLESELRDKSVGKSDPGAASLATYLGALGIPVAVDVVAQWLNLVPVLALEVGSALAGFMVHTRGAITTIESQTIKATRPPKTRHPRAQASPRTTAADAIVSQLHAHGGSLQSTERGLAQLIGAERSTVRRAIHGLAAGGLVALEATKEGTILRLA